jgi:hypothetical protein
MWPITYKTLEMWQFAGTFCATAVVALTKADRADFGQLAGGVEVVQRSSFWLLMGLTISVGIAKGLCKYYGPPWIWGAVRRLLSRYRDEAFKNIAGDPVHFHRVTLFKRRRWFWGVWPLSSRMWWRSSLWPWGPWRGPWSGWMVPLARSGQTTQKTDTVFLAPDDADNSEGMPGSIWQIQDTVTIKLPAIMLGSSDEEIQEYSRVARVSVKWIRRRLKAGKSLPLSLCGIPVEVNHTFWGVLVLDSRRADTIDYRGRALPAYNRLIAVALDELLQRV